MAGGIGHATAFPLSSPYRFIDAVGQQKCQVMGAAKAPLDIVGTGSFLPATLSETYATADIIAYDGVKRVKVGREFLFD